MFDSVIALLDEVLACGAPTPGAGTGPADPVDGVAADRVPAEPWSGLSAHDLVERIAAAERLTHAVQAAQTRDIHALAQARLATDRDRPGVGSRLEGRTTPFEIGLACGVSPQSATGRILSARRLVDEHPQLLALAESGAVSAWGLRLVLRHTDLLDPDRCRVVDTQLATDITTADGLTPGELEKAARRRVATIDPEADARRCARARADRQISIRDRVDGTGTLWARLKAEESVAIWGSLDGHARGRRDDGDPRSIATLMCDTLVERVTGIRVDPMPPETDHSTPSPGADATAGCGPVPWPTDPDPCDLDIPDPYQADSSAPHSDPAHPAPASATSRPGWTPCDQSSLRTRVELQVVFAASTLLGLDDQPGLLRGYGAIPAELVRQIADNSDNSVLRRLFSDPIDGRLFAMDTQTRCYKGSIRQFIVWRDQACRLSGADIKQADHIKAHADGGPTSIDNGQGLAKNPHVIRDHPDVTVEAVSYRPDPAADPDPQRLLGYARLARLARLRGNAPDVAWTMPTGHTYRRRPPPALGFGSRPPPRHRPQDRAHGDLAERDGDP